MGWTHSYLRQINICTSQKVTSPVPGEGEVKTLDHPQKHRKLLLISLRGEETVKKTRSFCLGAEILPGLCSEPTHSFVSTCTGTIPALCWGIHSITAPLTEGICHKNQVSTLGLWFPHPKGPKQCVQSSSWGTNRALLWWKMRFLVWITWKTFPFPHTISPDRLHHLWGHRHLLDFVKREETSPFWHRDPEWCAPKVLSGSWASHAGQDEESFHENGTEPKDECRILHVWIPSGTWLSVLCVCSHSGLGPAFNPS